MNTAALETPAAMVDEQRMMQNITRMQARMNALGVTFRPHAKTAKSIHVATRQRDAGATAITVSTLKEAEQFFAAGFADILYAVAIAPNKLDHAATLMRRGCQLKIIVDSIDGARAIADKARELHVTYEVMIEIDTDGHRAGVKPDEPRLIAIAQALVDGNCTLRGVMTHAGSSYDFSTAEALAAIAEQERERCVRAATNLRAAGVACPVVSVGSTPTALSARHLNGVTEVRAGVYVFFDLVMAGTGVCATDEIALSVLTSVIGHQPDKGWLIVDGGWMAMSRDRGSEKQAIDFGYGMVCDVDANPLEDFIVSSANQEHGIISRRTPQSTDDLARRFPIGTLLRILPNHACATAAQFPHYHTLMHDGRIEIWPRFHGW
jgi:D-serine deaminase-like pyridoxal phosphate-dependent protein